jgi:hypothetical protein
LVQPVSEVVVCRQAPLAQYPPLQSASAPQHWPSVQVPPQHDRLPEHGLTELHFCPSSTQLWPSQT